MANQTIDGLLLPVPVANHPALELCNTRAGWFGPPARDYLGGYPELAVWARENGLLTAARTTELLSRATAQPAQATAVLRSAKRFRASLHRTMVGDRPGDDQAGSAVLRTVSRALADARTVRTGDAGSGWRIEVTGGLRAPLDAFAIAALPLLEDGRSDEVHHCPGVGCGWLFHDPSGRRRWCIMGVCGNRAKARAWAERRRSTHPR